VPFRPLVVLVAGEPIDSVRKERGGYAALIRETVGPAWSGAWSDVDLRHGAPLPDPAEVSGVIVTGSSASVTERAPWMLRTEEYLRMLAERGVHTLGICFGHQLLGQALGGEVTKNPRGREIGTVDFEIVAEDELLHGASPPFRANATHVDTVLQLPPGARVLGRTQLEPHAIVRFSETTWGVQFHPEMDRTIVTEYLEKRRGLIESEGIDQPGLLARADDARAGASTLPKFAEIVSNAAR
jgi:GMP synthase (glutamine-hydrolysing)